MKDRRPDVAFRYRKATVPLKSDRHQGSYGRAIPLALLWVGVQSALYGYVHVNGLGQLIANHLPLVSLYFLILLVIFVHPSLARWLPRAKFTTTELTMIWVMVSAAASVPGYGLMEFIFPYIAAPMYGLGIVVGLVYRDAGRIALLGFIAGVISVVLYDCSRWPWVAIGVWGDFIPKIGGWMFNRSEPDWVWGYLWRYVGNGGGMGVGFFMGFHFIEPWIARRQAGILFGLSVFMSLLATLLLAPQAQEMLFKANYITFSGGLVGHLVYGYILGRLSDKWGVLDKLDELYDFNYFKDVVELDLQRNKRDKRPLSVVFFGVDNFKPFDDPYVHKARNLALRKLANIIKLQIRTSDVLSRYARNKFMVWLTGTSDEGARLVAERIRSVVDATPFSDDENGESFTVSGGIATATGEEQKDASRLFEEADTALSEAVAQGKNRNVAFSELAVESS